MDLQEWEILSDDSYIDLHEDQGAHKITTPKSPHTTALIDMNYFQNFYHDVNNNNNSRVIPVPIKFHQEELPEEVTKLPTSSSSKSDHHMVKEDDDQEMISKVFFKKLKDNEFVDMKMDSPKSQNRGILPPIDVGPYQFEEEAVKDGKFEKEAEGKDKFSVEDEEEKKVEAGKNWEDGRNNNGGLNIWKLAMTGMGAFISLGFAAATVSLIVFSNRHKESKQSKQELHFQIYSRDKRFKQMVHRATKLNEAISVTRGAPITRAHITIGGYYEGL